MASTRIRRTLKAYVHLDPREGTAADKFQPPPGEKAVEASGPLFDAEKGSIGRHFKPDGAPGGTAQKIGGPLDKDGMIGKQFTTEGSIGGSIQSALGADGEKAFQDKK